MELEGAVALVTGGRGGIGAALTNAFADAGATALAADLPGLGAEVELDVTDPYATAAALEAVARDHGRLDVVVANAGIGVAGLCGDIAIDDWRRSVEVNVLGTVHTVLAAYALMTAQRRGAIVVTASLAGLVGTPLFTPYAMTKAAVVGLAESLRPEAQRLGISVTTVCPGPVETPLLDVPTRTPGVSVRRALTATAGPAIGPEVLAAKVVDAVRRERAWVLPGRASLLSRLQRFVPGLVERELRRGLAKELAAAGID